MGAAARAGITRESCCGGAGWLMAAGTVCCCYTFEDANVKPSWPTFFLGVPCSRVPTLDKPNGFDLYLLH